MLPPLRKIICVCERAKKEKQERFFFNRETHIKIIVIDLIIVKLFGIYPVVFPFKEKGVFMCICYFGLLILLIILFGT